MASLNSQRAPSGFGTFMLGLATLAFLAVLLIVLIKAETPLKDTADAERGELRLKKRTELEKDWADKLHTVAWVDKAKGVVQVPIDDAIKSVAGELKAKKVAKSAVKVPPPLPAPVVDPKSTEPPLPALPSAPQGSDLIHFPAPAPSASAAPAADSTNVAVNATPSRPPLLNWTESK